MNPSPSLQTRPTEPAVASEPPLLGPRVGALGERLLGWCGPALTIAVVMAAAALSLQAYLPYGSEAALSIALGAGSIAAMSVTLMLSARPPYIEPLFGGLDRIYVVHKWLGIGALAMMVGHFVWDPEFGRRVPKSSVGEFASDIGELALYGFIGLILISWVKRLPFTRLELPWQLWRFTHRFTGTLFAVAALHQLAVDKPAGVDPLAGHYLNLLSVLGIVAWVYTQFLAPTLRRRSFVVESVEEYGDVAEVTVRPQGGAMRWRAGQFAFVSAPDAGLREPHPFTIASAPRADGRVRFGIKGLGGWTRRLPRRLEPGQRMWIEGPYGRFVFRRRARHQVWLAGGIGITPFLAWAEALTEADHQQIALIWAVRTPAEAFAAERLHHIAAQHPGLTVQVVCSESDGRLTAERLIGIVPFQVSHCELFYCGPTGLRDAVVSGLRANGQSPRRVHSEAFEMR